MKGQKLLAIGKLKELLISYVFLGIPACWLHKSCPSGSILIYTIKNSRKWLYKQLVMLFIALFQDFLGFVLQN